MRIRNLLLLPMLFGMMTYNSCAKKKSSKDEVIPSDDKSKVESDAGDKTDEQEDSTPPSDGSKFSKIDITDASQLFISGASVETNLLAGDTAVAKLYKIATDGAVSEVTYTDENTGETITDVPAPRAIFQPLTDYVLLAFESDFYLTRKSDGVAFTLADFKIDGNEVVGIGTDIYAKGSESDKKVALYKIDASDPANLTISTVSAVNDPVEKFAVDNQGNLLYTTNIIPEQGQRLRRANGKIENSAFTQFWTSNAGVLMGQKDSTNYKSQPEFGLLMSVIDNSVLFSPSTDQRFECEFPGQIDSFHELILAEDSPTPSLCIISQANASPSVICTQTNDVKVAGGNTFADLMTSLNALDGFSVSVGNSNQLDENGVPLAGNFLIFPSIPRKYESIASFLFLQGPGGDQTNCNGSGIKAIPSYAHSARIGSKIYDIENSNLKILDEESKAVENITLASDTHYDRASIRDFFQASSDALYVMGNSKLQKIALSDYSITDITPTEFLDISIFNVASDNSITMSGPKNDGSFSIGTLKDGKYSEASSTKDKVRTLSRIK